MRPERTIFKTMEQDKTQEGQLRKQRQAIFSDMIINMIQEFGERINAKNDKSKEVFNSQREFDIKKNQTKLKSTII